MKAILVTGGGSGIGRAVAIRFARKGWRVGLADIDARGLVDTAAMLPPERTSTHQMDVRDPSEWEHVLADFTALSGGRLDVLFNNAGVGAGGPFGEIGLDALDRVIDVNLKGNFHVLQAAGQLMTMQGSGSIVLFSSIRSLVTEPGQSVYSMTKSGIVQLVRTAATEWGQTGVRVNAVGPGVIETPLTAPIKAQPAWYNAYADKTPMKRWAKAEEMAGPTVFLLSDAASYVTGTILFADGGWLANDGRFTPPGM